MKQYYESINCNNWVDVEKLLKVYESILLSLQDRIRDVPSDLEQLDKLIEYLKRDNFEFKDGKIIFTGDPTLIKNDGLTSIESDLFKYQFPIGLPFGKSKPHVAIVSEKGSQKLSFEVEEGVGILRENIYPNFTFQNLELIYGVNEHTNTNLKTMLKEMNQTESEKKFLLAYASTFKMAREDVPLLIPQAWIQWHSLPKRNLRSNSSIHADDLYRIDFVAFWANKRYAILIDDIGHYSKKRNGTWVADEESYAKRLKEDRKLRKENWEVFRISNWEIREEVIPEILSDLKEFIGF